MGRKRKAVLEEKQQINENKQSKEYEQNNENKQNKKAGNKTDDKEANKKEDTFSWSDDEIQLLLMTALDFKSQCEFEGTNWESKRSKYEQIFELMMKDYPSADSENYQNRDSLNKDRITAKLKSIRTGFKKAADAGRKSGGGRVVFTFYDLCVNLWGGSPAVTSLPFGVDTSGQNDNDESEEDEPLSPTYSPQTEISRESSLADEQEESIGVERDEARSDAENKRNEDVTSGKDKLEKINKAATERRHEVTNMLKNRKDKKMASKLSVDAQLLQISRDDLTFKKELLEKIDQSDKEFRVGFTELNKTMSNIGTAIQQSVGILSQLVTQGIPNHAHMITPQPYQMHQTAYQEARAYPGSSTITSSNQNYSRQMYIASGDDIIRDEYDGNEKEYQNL